MKRFFILLLALFVSAPIFATASSVTVTYTDLGFPSNVKKVTVAWLANSTTAAVTDTVIALGGLVMKVVTNPGSTAPTANYDIACGDPSDTALDVFSATLANRHTTTTEQVYPVATNATVPVFVSSCTLQITNNAVNSATGTIDFYVVRP